VFAKAFMPTTFRLDRISDRDGLDDDKRITAPSGRRWSKGVFVLE
jgi:hypothetical protein